MPQDERITMQVSAEVRKRVARIVERLQARPENLGATVSEADVMRRALLIGLDAIETDARKTRK